MRSGGAEWCHSSHWPDPWPTGGSPATREKEICPHLALIREARATEATCVRNRGSARPRGVRCRGPGCAPQETLASVGQSPLNTRFQETHLKQSASVQAWERWVGGLAETGPRPGAETGRAGAAAGGQGGQDRLGLCGGPGRAGPAVCECTQPAAALQQGSRGAAGPAGPQAVCVLRVRSRVWPVDSPHVPVSFIAQCTLGFPADVRGRESHGVRSGPRLISRTWGVVLAEAARAPRLAWCDACTSSRGVSALRTGSLVPEPEAIQTSARDDAVCVRSAAPGAACLACWCLQSLQAAGSGRWPRVRSGPALPSSTVSPWR